VRWTRLRYLQSFLFAFPYLLCRVLDVTSPLWFRKHSFCATSQCRALPHRHAWLQPTEDNRRPDFRHQGASQAPPHTFLDPPPPHRRQPVSHGGVTPFTAPPLHRHPLHRRNCFGDNAVASTPSAPSPSCQAPFTGVYTTHGAASESDALAERQQTGRSFSRRPRPTRACLQAAPSRGRRG